MQVLNQINELVTIQESSSVYGDEIRQSEDGQSNMIGMIGASGVASAQARSRAASGSYIHRTPETTSPSPTFRYPTDDSVSN